jgi:hypothetical protein
LENLLATASSGTVSNYRNLDHAAVIATALEQIFRSSASELERRQAAVNYLRAELAGVERHLESDESFPPQPNPLEPPPADRIIGIAVQPQTVCRKCGDPVAIVGPGKPPHFSSLHCRSCGVFRSWLPRAHGAYLAEVVADAGVPREPLRLHSLPEKNDDGRSVVRHDMRKD